MFRSFVANLSQHLWTNRQCKSAMMRSTCTCRTDATGSRGASQSNDYFEAVEVLRVQETKCPDAQIFLSLCNTDSKAVSVLGLKPAQAKHALLGLLDLLCRGDDPRLSLILQLG